MMSRNFLVPGLLVLLAVCSTAVLGHSRRLQQPTIAIAGSTSTGVPTSTQSFANQPGQQVVNVAYNGQPIISSGNPPSSTSSDSTPICKNNLTSSNFQTDAQGQKWGFENGVSCKYPPPQQYPNCTSNATAPVTDSSGQHWGLENGKSCKFPMCTGAPDSSAVADSAGGLWGYQNGTSCKYP